ncbi:MAG: DUF2141 domain-containing protein [Myxococcales bacterium]|nr:DUF2141 domain-containing protein [Myxococcales bacterium]
MRTLQGIILSIALLLCLTTCAGEPSSVPQAGTISGVIQYDGVAQGPGRTLSIALYRSFPPVGPPIQSELIETYSFPYRYELTDLAPGTYYVGALIDVDRLDTRYSGMLNVLRDPYGYASSSLHSTRGVAAVNITLIEEVQ